MDPEQSLLLYFLLSSFPAAVCVFSVTVNGEVVSYWFSPGTWHYWISCVAMVLTLVVVTLIVLDDFTSKPVAPYILKTREVEESSRLEQELRAAAELEFVPRTSKQNEGSIRGWSS